MSQYGVPGIISTVLIGAIGACIVWIKNIIRDHKEEREEIEKLHRQERDDWKRTIERQFEDSNKTSNNATAALTELTTILKTRK